MEPGDLVFSDQFVSSLPGKVFGKRGESISSNSYSGGTLFCDAASKKIFVNCQVSLGAYEIIESKLMFERDAQTSGVTVKAYCTDNGVYTSKEFMKELDASGQGIKHSGVSGHHHKWCGQEWDQECSQDCQDFDDSCCMMMAIHE